MTVFAIPPDVDAAVIAFGKAHAALLAIHGGRFATELPAYTGAPPPAVRLTNLGGPESKPWLWISEFQAECWGGTAQQANLLARTLCAAIKEFRGPITDGYVIAAYPTVLPIARPDPVTARPRYITQFQVEATPEEPQP